MPANCNKPERWKQDIAESVDSYNDWFMRFAPTAFRATRVKTTETVKRVMAATNYLRRADVDVLRQHPDALPVLRMATCPPLAVDRLIGLAGAPDVLVKTMDKFGRLPPRMAARELTEGLNRIGEVIRKLADTDILVWVGRKQDPSEEEIHRASTVIADRLCGAQANPIIRNAQEQRQLEKIAKWLSARDYVRVEPARVPDFRRMLPGTFSFRLNVEVRQRAGGRTLKIPIDAVIKPTTSRPSDLPLLVEAKSAGDYTNVNKRRKEEAAKMSQLIGTYGRRVRYVLFLNGYFDSGYLGYEAAEGLDWVWEHRIDDFIQLGL